MTSTADDSEPEKPDIDAIYDYEDLDPSAGSSGLLYEEEAYGERLLDEEDSYSPGVRVRISPESEGSESDPLLPLPSDYLPPGEIQLEAVLSDPTREALATPPRSPFRRPRQQEQQGGAQMGLPTQQQLLEGARQFWRDEFDKEQKRLSVAQVLSRPFMLAPFYPFRYVQRLIQLGYEPVPPVRRYSRLFHRYQYYYPGVFRYARAIARTEGWTGLYRGVATQFVSDLVEQAALNLLYPIIHRAVLKIPLPFGSGECGDMPDTDPDYRHSLPSILTRGTRRFLVGILSKSAVQLIVHPFHVITMRTIAQEVGKETVYNGVWSACKEIYRTEGLGGFYAGLAPALLGHLCVSVIHSSLWLVCEMVVANLSSDVLKIFVWTMIGMPLMTYVPGTYSYPFALMSNMMAVNGCGLKAAMPPRVPAFSGWMDCYRYLKSTGNMYRGSAVLFSRFAYRDIPAIK